MLLINLNTILYTLNHFKAYVLQAPAAKTNIALLANNTIVFTLTKGDLNNLKNINCYNTRLISFININYLDEKFHTLKRPYPVLKTKKNNSKQLFEQIFKLIQKNKMSNFLSSIILKRDKTKFHVRLLGVLGYVNFSSVFTNFSNLWNKKEAFNYTDIIRFMLYWLHTNLIITTNSSFLKILLEKQNTKIITKQNKIFNQKKANQKTLIVFSNENILCN